MYSSRRWKNKGKDPFQDEHDDWEVSIASISDSEATGTPTSGDSKRGLFSHLSGRFSNASRKSKSASGRRKSSLDVAKHETRMINILRLVVFILLFSAATFVCVTVYVFLKMEEEQTFEEQFYDLAFRLVEGFHSNSKLRVQVVDMLSISLTSSALATDQVWPFVTIRDFEAQATAARSVLGASFIGVYPRVIKELRRPWEEYTQQVENLQWINESVAFQNEFMETHNRSSDVTRQSRALLTQFSIDFESGANITVEDISNNVTFDGTYGTSSQIFRAGDPDSPSDDGKWVYEKLDSPGPFYPMWQMSPAEEAIVVRNINYNIIDPDFHPSAYIDAIPLVMSTGNAVFGGVWNVDEDGYIDEDDDFDQRTVPAASLLYPVFDKIVPDEEGEKSTVAVIELDYEFGPFFSSVLPPNADPVIAVVSNCKQVFSYQVTGVTAEYLGAEDAHDPNFDEFVVSTLMTDFEDSGAGTVYNGAPIDKEYCPWKLNVYATQEMKDHFVTSNPIYYMLAVLGVFFFTCVTFIAYDRIVERRQKMLMNTAVKSDKIVASLFPKGFQEALYKRESVSHNSGPIGNKTQGPQNGHAFLSANYQTNTSKPQVVEGAEPLAKLYPDCTVFFADIAGFTAWSSARSPAHVFTLLETIYAAFDSLADKHSVFKIETIGDCYVCVTGLPEAQPKHAILMVKFARDCLGKMAGLTRQLEGSLGPGTGDLAIRVGLHSGPVTAGVLRGKKARFQLFGDTVNTASRMESNGRKNCIHASPDTADILVSQGKSHWVMQREDKIVAKGKGEIQTYWIRPTSSSSATSSVVSDSTDDKVFDTLVSVEEALKGLRGTDMDKLKWAEENYRSIGWTVDLLFKHLKWIVVERRDSAVQQPHNEVWSNQNFSAVGVVWDDHLCESLFELGDSSWHAEEDFLQFRGGKAEDQLRIFITCIAYKYNQTPFHNYTHACQVLMSADNMMEQLSSKLGPGRQMNAWMKFVVLLAAIIRDMDPSNSDNLQVSFEDGDDDRDGRSSSLSFSTKHANTYYRSLQSAWRLLLDERLYSLRVCLCSNKDEFYCFRQLLVNLVVGADMSNSAYAIQREYRWNAAFRGYDSNDDASSALTLATVSYDQAASILEHISLAAQWTHTMQHWQNYKKWNAKLYQELCDDYENGTLSIDPSRYWYQQELILFDNVIIPLAEKLQLPFVLGAAGSEYLKFAWQNRRGWESTQKHLAPQSSSCVEYET
ncbi:Receptor-type guanylate cyclase gcy [Seminavis robusta]|uniref:Receptor-type guanylate cyclase gcy n=1 Tax=Seminavis robusta TaxID=568900 RepID=A0A9N8EYL2_9STRA|nr:Receptor-type guanylate cyclase gcy [Seminavis robusta]|eukprot:Sro2139_g316150.1 Receptor-type guanylate cyclase gcy (1223) ;mRNA; r:10518-14530